MNVTTTGNQQEREQITLVHTFIGILNVLFVEKQKQENLYQSNNPREMKKKEILDVCCGGRMFWFNKSHPNVLYVDRRVMQPKVVGSGKDARIRKCLPDEVMDFRALQLPNDSFSLVVFDPPHLFLGENSYMAQNYGALDKKTWKEDITKGFAECFRVLKPNGVLIFKWNEHDVPLKEILQLTPVEPLFGHPSGKTQLTHWVTFMKLSL